jgi:ribosomal protein L17
MRTRRNSSASSNATKEWYHIVAAEKLIAYGKKAQTHAARFAVRRLKLLRAMRKIGTEVTAEMKLFKLRKTKADAFVYTPQMAKMPASRYG